MKTIYFAVISDLSFDQRMMRICRSLSLNGYRVVLVGKKINTSIPLQQAPYQQVRLHCFFSAGKLYYLEFNLKLFLFLLFKKMDAICAIDLDTIVPCYWISKIKRIKRVYDAHELFCEMQEIVSRPAIYRFWKRVERWVVPKFKYGYTVDEPIADEFNKMYGVNYEVVRNIPLLDTGLKATCHTGDFLIYQGSVNEGRSFETLIPAMQTIPAVLQIYGDGNFMQRVKTLIKNYNLENKVALKGPIPPDELRLITPTAKLGITLFERRGLSNYYSLANRFFDYLHAAIPQLCVNYPAYQAINRQYEVAVLIDDLSPENIAKEINSLLTDEMLYNRLRENCILARQAFNWQKEETKLLTFYKSLWS